MGVEDEVEGRLVCVVWFWGGEVEGKGGVGAKGEPRRPVRKEKRDLLVEDEEVEGRCWC